MFKKFLLETPAGLHLDWKIQSALKGFSMREYAILALDTQIERDKTEASKPKEKEDNR